MHLRNRQPRRCFQYQGCRPPMARPVCSSRASTRIWSSCRRWTRPFVRARQHAAGRAARSTPELPRRLTACWTSGAAPASAAPAAEPDWGHRTIMGSTSWAEVLTRRWIPSALLVPRVPVGADCVGILRNDHRPWSIRWSVRPSRYILLLMRQHRFTGCMPGHTDKVSDRISGAMTMIRINAPCI